MKKLSQCNSDESPRRSMTTGHQSPEISDPRSLIPGDDEPSNINRSKMTDPMQKCQAI